MTTSVPEPRLDPAGPGDRPNPQPKPRPNGRSDRYSQMVEAASGLQPDRSKVSLDTVLFVLGSICLPAGLAAIFAGWYGVSHTGYLWQQNSYLISGGILGLGLIIIGGFLFFGSWIARHIQATEAGTQAILAALNSLRTPAADPAAPVESPGHSTNGAAARTAGLPFVVTEKGGLFHRPDCPVVAGKKNLRAVGPDPDGYRPCRVCDPTGLVGT